MLHIKNKAATVLDMEMDRKDFLKYAVLAFLTLVGVTGLLRWADSALDVFGTKNRKRGTYGYSAYGK